MKKPFRVLHIVPSLDYVSGIIKVLLNYFEKINRDNIVFDFLYIKNENNDVQKRIEDLGGRTFYIGNVLKYLEFKKNMDDFCCIHFNEYSIVHLHIPFLAIFFYKMKKKMNAKAFIIHAHSTKLGNTKLTNIRNKILYCLFMKKADSYFACSSLAGNELFGNDYIKNGYLMFNIPDDAHIYGRKEKREAKKLLSLNDDNVVVGHVGNFYAPKNHFFLIDIFEKMYSENNKCRLLLVGDGSLLEKVKKYVRYKKIDNAVIFVGRDIKTSIYYSAMDVFIFPSIFEGFALSVLEAQLYCIPCVISSCVPVEVNISSNNIFLSTRYNSADDWKDAAIKLIRNNNEIYVNKFGLFDKYVSELEEKYLELIESCGDRL